MSEFEHQVKPGVAPVGYCLVTRFRKRTKTSLNDDQLMEAFEDIIKDHSPKIYYFLRNLGLSHEDADELVEEVFVSFWRDLKGGHGLAAVAFRLYQHAVKNVLSFYGMTIYDPLVDVSLLNQLSFLLKHAGFDFMDISEMTGLDMPAVRAGFKAHLEQASS
jgi:hypothetical protein